METQSALLLSDSGSSPTSPHQLFLRRIPKRIAKIAYNRWHYLGHKGFLSTINYGIYHNEELLGAISFGIPNAKNVKGFFDTQTQNTVFELSRLALSEKCPKNSESHVISIAMKLLKKDCPHINLIITYADISMNHSGTIYKASNFQYVGITKLKTDLYVKGKKVGKIKGVKYSEIPNGVWIKRSQKHLFYKSL